LVGCEAVLLQYGASADDEVVDEHDHGDDQDQVNERSAHVERKTQQPKDKQNYKDCPKHVTLQCSLSEELRIGNRREKIVSDSG
jgi:hypothetical protein